MNKLLILGNWKMNLGISESTDLLIEFKKQLMPFQEALEIVICPSLVFLLRAKEILEDTDIKLAAQNIFWQEKGAYTGETSVGQIIEAGCKYVVIGHSEQRQYGHETSQEVNKSVLLALPNGIRPVICIGETFDQRKDGKKNVVICDQLSRALKNVQPTGNNLVIVAYEPVWAISTNQGYYCQPDEAKETAAVIKSHLLELYPDEVVTRNFVICYGGSINKENVKDYVDKKNYWGALVGGASTKADQFPDIIELLTK